MQYVRRAASLLICSIAVVVNGEAIKLAGEGCAHATIVIPSEAEPRIRQAAEDLRHYVQAICDVELPVRADGQAVVGTGLYLGRCGPTRDDDFPGSDLNPEAYAIRIRDGSIYFTARHPTPVHFAVSSFIEEELGVRWFAPGELWEDVTRGVPGELLVNAQDRVSVPDTSPRIWSGHGWYPSWIQWMVRNKVELPEVYPRREYWNNLYKVFPPSKYAAEHPEYYPMVGGKRWIPETDEEYLWFPCSSNPEVLQITIDFARKWFDANPTNDSFSLGMDDVVRICGCDKCRALDATPQDYANRTISSRYYQFVNSVAREIRKTHPDRLIGTLIYREARELPATVQQLEPNVFGYLTEECFSWWQQGQRGADHALSRAWAERCAHMSRYDYYGMGTFTPRFAPHVMAEQIKLDKSLGFEGMYAEVYTFLPHTAPMIWALAKMQWHSDLDIEVLLDEYCAKMYGSAAAPAMRQYFDFLESAWMEDRPDRTKRWVHRDLDAQAQSITQAQVERALTLLDEAKALVDGDERRALRIDIHRAALVLSGYVVESFDRARELQAVNINSPESADRAISLASELANLSARRRAYFRKMRDRDDLLGQNFRAMTDQMRYFQTDALAARENLCYGAAIEALNWHVQNDTPGTFDTRIGRLRQDAVGMEFAKVLNAWSLVHKGLATNLLDGRERKDHVLNVLPTRRYLVGADVRSLPVPEQAVELRIRFRDNAGQWLESDRELSVAPAAGCEEQRLWVVVDTPPGAYQLVLTPCRHRSSEALNEYFSNMVAYWLE